VSDEPDGVVRGADVVEQLKASGALDALFARIDSGEIEMTGDGGLIPGLIKAALERGLQAELSDHLGYVKGDPEATLFANSRNGTTPKTLASQVGEVPLAVPRDRAGSFTPRLVPKGSRRLGGLDEMIISLYAGGMTIRDIQHHLARTIGTELSHETISNITDAVLDEVKAWQGRPLEEIYPIMYLDALLVKVRDGHQVRNRAAHIAVGVDLDGVKHVLGIWVQAVEGAKFWAGVCAELRNRGIRDVLIVCCDGLTGFPEAIEAIFPATVVQTCVVHPIRHSLKYVPRREREQVARDLKPIYTAVDADAAQQALEAFDEKWGRRFPVITQAWLNAWEYVIPFLAFPPEVRRVIYTTNAIEALNRQLRKAIKTKGHFPNEEAARKLIYLAITNAVPAWTRTRSWTTALLAFKIHFGDRLPD
jgi:putative transposase